MHTILLQERIYFVVTLRDGCMTGVVNISVSTFAQTQVVARGASHNIEEISIKILLTVCKTPLESTAI